MTKPSPGSRRPTTNHSAALAPFFLAAFAVAVAKKNPTIMASTTYAVSGVMVPPSNNAPGSGNACAAKNARKRHPATQNRRQGIPMCRTLMMSGQGGNSTALELSDVAKDTFGIKGANCCQIFIIGKSGTYNY